MMRFAYMLMLLATSAASDLPLAAAQSTTEAQSMTEAPMPADRFWELIDKTTAHASDPERQAEVLRQVLRQLTVAEIEAFERAFQQQQRRAYSWDLWGAAYIMNGGASDDGFEYFQRWLVSRGRKIFEAAIANPESLADLPTSGAAGDHEFEEFAAIAGGVWAEKTGTDPWSDPQARFPYGVVPLPPEPAGDPFEEDADHLAKRYPKLWARFGMQ